MTEVRTLSGSSDLTEIITTAAREPQGQSSRIPQGMPPHFTNTDGEPHSLTLVRSALNCTQDASAPSVFGCFAALDRRGVAPRYRPVSSCALCTGLDSGEPCSRSQIESTTKAPTAKNSLCQFWKDSNQKRDVPTYWSMETGG